MARHAAAQSIAGGTRALIVGTVATLVASLLAMFASRGPANQTEQAAQPLRRASPTASPFPSPSPSSSSEAAPSPSASASASPSARRSRTPTRSPAPRRPPVTADHDVRARWDSGQIARITVRNPGRAATEWTVVLVLDSGVRLRRFWTSDRDAVDASQDGTTVRFTGRVGPGDTVVVEYLAERARGASSEPRSCRVNGIPCQ